VLVGDFSQRKYSLVIKRKAQLLRLPLSSTSYSFGTLSQSTMQQLILFTFLLMAALVRGDFSGAFTMTSATTDEGDVSMPSSRPVTLKMTVSDSNTYKAFFRAGNNMIGSMTLVETLSESEARIQFSQIPSTRMLAPPEFRECESFITQKIPFMNLAKFDTDGNLVFEGPDNLSAVFAPGEDNSA
jgi:hypothetical protein